MQGPNLAGLAPPQRLPRGPHGLSRAEISASQRQRLLAAGVELLAEKGLATTVADVTAKAGVSRKTFYDHFGDREDCLLAAYDTCTDALQRHLLDTALAAEDAEPAEQLRAAVRGYLEFLADSPVLARAALVEGPTIGARAVEHCAASRRAIAGLIQGWHGATRQRFPDYPPVPDSAFTALVGAMHELAFQQVVAGHPERLRELEPAIMQACRALLGLPG